MNGRQDLGEFLLLPSKGILFADHISRWLVHSIASYYGLHTWSITVGDRREAYVGFRPPVPGSRTGLVSQPACSTEALVKPGEELPQPLYAQV